MTYDSSSMRGPPKKTNTALYFKWLVALWFMLVACLFCRNPIKKHFWPYKVPVHDKPTQWNQTKPNQPNQTNPNQPFSAYLQIITILWSSPFDFRRNFLRHQASAGKVARVVPTSAEPPFNGANDLQRIPFFEVRRIRSLLENMVKYLGKWTYIIPKPKWLGDLGGIPLGKWQQRLGDPVCLISIPTPWNISTDISGMFESPTFPFGGIYSRDELVYIYLQ